MTDLLTSSYYIRTAIKATRHSLLILYANPASVDLADTNTDFIGIYSYSLLCYRLSKQRASLPNRGPCFCVYPHQFLRCLPAPGGPQGTGLAGGVNIHFGRTPETLKAFWWAYTPTRPLTRPTPTSPPREVTLWIDPHCFSRTVFCLPPNYWLGPLRVSIWTGNDSVLFFNNMTHIMRHNKTK